MPSDEQRSEIKRRDTDIERLNAIFHALDEGIIVQDTEGRVLIENAAAKKLIGSRKDFWTSELGTLFNAFGDVVRLESELAPLGEACTHTNKQYDYRGTGRRSCRQHR